MTSLPDDQYYNTSITIIDTANDLKFTTNTFITSIDYIVPGQYNYVHFRYP